MSWKVHPTDEVFAALRGLCSNSYRMYAPCEYRYHYDHDCETYDCAVEDAAQEYERLLRHCEKQREELAAIKNPLGRLKEAFMGSIEGSSITDELRLWAARELASWKMARERYDDLIAIADRIDERHERGMADAELGASPTEEQMAELGWVKLPVDADGVPINVGDEVEYDGVSEKVTTLSLWSGGWNLGTEYGDFDNRRVKGYELELLDHPELFRHRKHDSWEGIIKDAANYDRDGWSGTFNDFVEELVERCRRLAGEGA